MSASVLRFAVGDRPCALPVSAVEEVVRIVAIRPLAGAPSFIDGVINLRGVIIPVIDLRKRAGLSPGPFDASTHLVISTVRGRSTALIVDEVSGVDAANGDPAVCVLDPSTILTDAEGAAFDATPIP